MKIDGRERSFRISNELISTHFNNSNNKQFYTHDMTRRFVGVKFFTQQKKQKKCSEGRQLMNFSTSRRMLCIFAVAIWPESFTCFTTAAPRLLS